MIVLMRAVLAAGFAIAAFSAAAQEQKAGEAAQEAEQVEVAGDPEAGETIFNRCRACHTVEPGKNLVGPSLHGVVGREAGAVEGYMYSEALLEADVTWTEENLHAYLENPNEFIPGNKMVFPGLESEEDRQNVIAFLAEQTQVAEQAE